MLIEDNKRFFNAFVVTTIILVIAIAGFIYLEVKPELLDAYSNKCRFSQDYHLYCPGCGGTRSMHALLAGDLLTSFMYHPLPIYSIVFFLRMWVALLYNTLIKKGKERPCVVLHDWEAWALLIVVLGNFILRNVLLVGFHIDYIQDLIQFW